MHKISAAALAVLLTATTGLAATAPAMAQPNKPPMGHHMGNDGDCQAGDGQRSGGRHGHRDGGWNGQRNGGWDGQRGGPRGGMDGPSGRGNGPGMCQDGGPQYGGGRGGPNDRGPGPGMRQDGPQFGGGMGGPGMRQGGPQFGGGMAGLFNFQRGAEAIEIALVRLSHRLNLTDEQRPLFDQMRTSVMDALRTYLGTTADVRAERSTPTAPLTLPDLLQRRIVLEQAQLDALTSIVPSVTAFYQSLTPEQQAMLNPPQRGGRGGGNSGGPDNQQGPGPSGSAPDAPPPAPEPGAAPAGDQPAPPAPPSEPAAPPAPPAEPAPPIRG